MLLKGHINQIQFKFLYNTTFVVYELKNASTKYLQIPKAHQYFRIQQIPNK